MMARAAAPIAVPHVLLREGAGEEVIEDGLRILRCHAGSIDEPVSAR
ncbi:hypothetical protein Airi01_085200 [Actinoallomurus iriomotensis]|uniref:Uncharacterized protein n=1 Tax=Actinoallomurus iriomotensis TaxID=478107 RepID=A0A9W6RR54_9ACTN|nr:hypothetical protein Airi01_085200 [Actinoallomurus iriomotensis]